MTVWTLDDLRRALTQDLSRLDIVLLLLGAAGQVERRVADVRQTAKDLGMPEVAGWNIPHHLSRSGGMAVKSGQGWILTSAGLAHVQTLLAARPPAARNIQADLRTIVSAVSDPHARAFLQEAVTCFESKCLRAAVVLSWVGAVSLMHSAVIDRHLGAFNAEATRRSAKWQAAVTTDDLTRLKERDLLDILEVIGLIGKDVKKQLIACLDLRNSCGHPNSLNVGDNMVAAHLEALILNVYKLF